PDILPKKLQVGQSLDKTIYLVQLEIFQKHFLMLTELLIINVKETDFLNNGIIILQSEWIESRLLSENSFPGIFTEKDTLHYKEHFKYLFTWIDNDTNNNGNDNNLYAQVIDFSIAEGNGFVKAYIEHGLQKLINKSSSLSENMIKSHMEYLKEEAKSLLKDCLLKINEKSEFDKVIESIQKSWPNIASSWLKWWVHTDVGKMLFPTLSSMDEDLSGKSPDSIIAQESMHHRYYMCGTTHQSIITDYSDRNKGLSLGYGETERWKKVAELYGTTKPSGEKK
ncbi:12586_t:CDS:2, partial [Entrophospora sp. SA101]